MQINAFVSGRSRSPVGWMLALALVLLGATRAHAVPAFAIQTAQPCVACHVGGFGPQLTPFGRNFKLNGYTMRATRFSAPISAMAIASYIRTAKDQVPAPAAGFRGNDNDAVDQASLFFAGGFASHLGAFVQVTYDGIAKAWTWDNLDVRFVTKVPIKTADVTLGVSLNNSPSVQDAWNTLPAWGFPYTSSSLGPSPAASPLLAGALAQNTLGMTGYAWINGAVFIEGGAYGSPGATTLTHLGADPFSPGDIAGLAPYGRIAVQKAVGAGTLEVGAFGMAASIHPGRDRSTGLNDRYTDLGVDASFQRPMAGGHVFSINARYLHEQQSLKATCVLAGAPPGGCASNDLSDLRADVSYYWRGRIGGTIAAFDTFGSANPVIYAANRTFRPDSSGVMFQIDGAPFGGDPQPQRRINVRAGLQYTMFRQFDGAAANFDGAGRRASDNDTLRVFTWFAF